MTWTKLSIQLFYLRIFPKRNFRIAVYVMMGLTFAYGIAFIFGFVFQCKPVSMAWENWDKSHRNATCHKVNLFGWLSGAINIILDIITIALPLRELSKLVLSRKKKIHIILMFSVGFL
jgi:hypothetical protein